MDSLKNASQPDSTFDLALQALWWDHKGDWDRAHTLSQKASSQQGDPVHAYLHRKEGDKSNASYWYSRAGEPVYQGSLDEEWHTLVEQYLKPQ